MPDKDLRKQALTAGKTTSRKAQRQKDESLPSSRGNSRPSSAQNSRPASRVASRHASDDEDEFSDDTSYSINSIDALLESDDFNESSSDALKQDLNDTIEELLDRKNSNNKSREDALIHYNRCLASHHFGDVLYGKVDPLVTTFLRSVKAETSSKEAVAALRALALTAISFENATIYDSASGAVKRAISDSQDMAVKSAAINTLGYCLMFGGVSEAEIVEQMTSLLEIVQSDGSFVGADDNAEVVTAAIENWTLLATYVDDLEDESEDAVEAFLEQLDSSNAKVQSAAGEAIALLFEKSYTPREDDETTSDMEEGTNVSSDDDDDRGDTTLVKRYAAYHNAHEVHEKTLALASLSTKTLNRHEKKKLHQIFTSVAITVENPRMGLRTNTSSRMIVKIYGDGGIKVDNWWKLVRLNALRRLLAHGFLNHYHQGNSAVLDSLPVIIRGVGAGAWSPRKGHDKQRNGDKWRDARRFMSA